MEDPITDKERERFDQLRSEGSSEERDLMALDIFQRRQQARLKAEAEGERVGFAAVSAEDGGEE